MTVDLSSFYMLKNIEEIDLPGNNINNIGTIVCELTNLKTLNLANNNLYDISGLIETQYNEQGNPYVAKYCTVENLILEKNHIVDISVLSYLRNLKLLNLKNNNIYNIESLEGLDLTTLYLQNQQVTMDIYKKQNNPYQYIMLLNLFQSVKNPESIIYDSSADFEYTGVTLNTSRDEYMQVPYYNVIIPVEYNNYEERDLEVKINGGDADGSYIKFNLTESSSAIDSLMFEDQNLDKAIYEYLLKNKQSNSYIARAPFIINIAKQEIFNVDELDLSSNNITNISGLSNFSFLNTLNLSDNNISNDEEIKYLTYLSTLYLTNNKLNGKYTSIENLYNIKTLSLSGNNITTLDSLDKLIKNMQENYKQIQLTTIILSNNKISDISVLSEISTLETIDISGNNVTDISALEKNTNIKTLNISNNNIEDISAIKSFANTLNTFNASKNIISDISSIKYTSLTELNLASNKIQDISVVKTQTMLKTLNLSANKIEDIQSIEALSISKYSLQQQKLVYGLNSTEDEETIILPKIFTQARTTGSKIYTSEDFKVEGCTLSQDKTSVTVNKAELNGGIAKVTIKGGYADGTTLSIAEVIKGTITYSTEEITNNDVIATITFNRQGATITNNEGKNTYTFTENGSFTFNYQDDNGFEAKSTANVDWIDKIPPTIQGVEKGKTYTNAVIPIITDEHLDSIVLKKDGKEVSGFQSGQAIEEVGEYELSASDKASNSVSIKFTIKNKTINIESDEYTVNSNNNTISKIQPNTTIKSFKQKISTDANEYKLVNKNGTQKSESEKIATGDKLITSDEKQYTICVTGDVSGDGISDIKDIFAINKHRLNTSTLKDAYAIAGDVNGDNKVDIKDIFQINKYRLGTISKL